MMSEAVHDSNEKKVIANPIAQLNYDPEIRQFRHSGVDRILRKRTLIGYNFHYIHDYYSERRYGNLVDDDILRVRRLVFNFKDGRNANAIANLITDALESLNFELLQEVAFPNACLVVIPASTPEKTEIRYRTFCDTLARNLGIENGYAAITTVPHKSTKGTAGGDKIKYFTFHNELYDKKQVVLFDDVRTSGTTFTQVLSALLDTGATNVMGIFLAKTFGW